MKRIVLLFLFFLFVPVIAGAIPVATTLTGTSAPGSVDFMSKNAYANMQPFMNNKMRTALNPGVTPSASDSVNAYVRQSGTSGNPRRVVARSAGIARAASGGTANNYPSPVTNARAAVAGAPAVRRVVARNRSGRADDSYYNNNLNYTDANNVAALVATDIPVSSARCMADYAECMNGYCVREKTEYNRCYCSAKLSQIDAEYQPAIDSLIRKILELRGGGAIDQDEMNKYWESTIGQYTGDNKWLNVDSALDIDWTDTESRVRGQQAFATGHDYCSQHLRGCFYMASNLRDAYRSDIARDCALYEGNLRKIKNAAESVVENYRE